MNLTPKVIYFENDEIRLEQALMLQPRGQEPQGHENNK
jgi:hypothetical protein